MKGELSMATKEKIKKSGLELLMDEGATVVTEDNGFYDDEKTDYQRVPRIAAGATIGLVLGLSYGLINAYIIS